MSLKGVDIASYQKDMDVSKIDADFVIIKITQGDYYINPSFNKQFNQAINSGKLVGAYHYSNGVKPVEKEVEHLYNAVKPYIGKVIVCLDWETNGSTKNSGLNPMFGKKEGVEYVRQFVYAFHDKTGVWPLVYMSSSVTRQFDWSPVAKVSRLWVAQYGSDKLTGYQTNPYKDNKGVGAFKEEAIRQYSPSGTITGYEQNSRHKLDMDIAYISREEWEKLAKGESTVPTYKKISPAIIRYVCSGQYGSGAVRKNKLTAEGYNYEEVQKKVNEVVAIAKEVKKFKIQSGDYWDAVLSLM